MEMVQEVDPGGTLNISPCMHQQPCIWQTQGQYVMSTGGWIETVAEARRLSCKMHASKIHLERLPFQAAHDTPNFPAAQFNATSCVGVRSGT